MEGKIMRFTMDFLKGGYFDGIENISFEGINLAGRWNGWARPVFTKEVADEIMSVINNLSNELGAMEYNGNDDCYIAYESGEEIERFGTIEVDGNTYYAIGTDCWVWEEA